MKLDAHKTRLCKQPLTPLRVFDKKVTQKRANFILTNSTKWVNGSEIKYMFIEGPNTQKNVVRNAFKIWEGLDIGIRFTETTNVNESLVRIGFDQNDGSWSYVGRQVLTIPKKERTMNFGWDLTTPYGFETALHEIGHTIGFEHEHQSPFSGIEWDVPAVYNEFKGPPNKWNKSEIDTNILNKLSPNRVKGSKWDPKSIMQYEFGPGLILKPDSYKNGITPPGVISANDKKGVREFYPPLKSVSVKTISPNKKTAIAASTGYQSDFVFRAPDTNKFTFETSGALDTVMIIYEKGGNENYYLAGDDDSGLDKNAKITLPLVKGRDYLVNIRVMYASGKNKGTLIVK